MRHKDTITLYDYWKEIRRGRPAPERTEIAPQALGPLLGSVFILEEGNHADMIFRLAGTRLCAMWCEELKTRSFKGLFVAQDRIALERILRGVTNSHSMAVIETEARNRDGRSVQSEILLLPLEPGMILGVWSPFSRPFWLGAHPVTELELSSIRLMDPDAGLAFLQNRPAVPVRSAESEPRRAVRPFLRAVSGSDGKTAKRRPFPFRVFDGGKK